MKKLLLLVLFFSVQVLPQDASARTQKMKLEFKKGTPSENLISAQPTKVLPPAQEISNIEDIEVKPKDNAVAVVIGNKNYKKVFPVDYAQNDAKMVKKYLSNVLGYKNENIIYLEDANYSELAAVLGREGNHKGRLYSFIKPNSDVELFIYYSGHGAPDPNEKQGYIIPVDCDPNLVALNGYSLKTFYDNLDKIAEEKKVKNITVVIDACFSGNSDKGVILKDVSPVYISIEKEGLKYPNSSVFSSASSEQVSNWYTDKRMSMFTYFFLKGLKGEADFNKDGRITTEELYKYVSDDFEGLPYWARRVSGREQIPTFQGTNFDLLK